MKTLRWTAGLGAFLVALAVITVAFLGLPGQDSGAGGSGSSAVAAPGNQSRSIEPLPPEQLRVLDSLSAAFEHVAAQLRPSVVSITSTRTVSGTGVRGQQIPEHLREFFGEDFFERFKRQRPGGGMRRGVGTGVIVSPDGYILTNAHVVRGADKVEVTLHDERSLEADIVGRDDKTDVAVLRIDAENLVPAPMGDSDKTSVGQWVMAMGSPFELHQTVTAGIISATGRDRVGITEYEDFLQTDAAINPGNSGGPLVNLHGEVIGINTAIASKSGGYMGIGFAIPINMASAIRDELIETGEVRRGRLGVVIQDLTPALADSFGLKGTEGALVGDVMKGGPAGKAGIKTGDIITEFDGKSIESVTELRNTVAATEPGSNVDVEVFRDGEYRTIDVKIGSLVDDSAPQASPAAEPSALSAAGLTVRELTENLRQQIGADEDLEGMAVVGVKPGSAAHEAGLRTGDVIVDVNGKTTVNAKRFEKLVTEESLKKGLRMTVARQGTRRFVFLQSD